MDPSPTETDWAASMSVQDSALALQKEAATIAAEAADTLKSVFSVGNSWMSSLSGLAQGAQEHPRAPAGATAPLALEEAAEGGAGAAHTVAVGLGAGALRRLRGDASGDLLRRRLGIGGDTVVLESFVCSLLQPYRCTANAFTPEIRVVASGILVVTAAGRACFGDMREGPGARAAFDIAGEAMRSATRVGGDAGDVIRVELSGGEGSEPAGPTSAVELSGFEGDAELEECLALLEHLCESGGPGDAAEGDAAAPPEAEGDGERSGEEKG